MRDRKAKDKEYREDNRDIIVIRQREYYKTINGVLTEIYSTQRKSSKRRGHPLPSYTKLELKHWLYNNTNFLKVYHAWVDSGYNTRLKPSVDRLDDYIGYRMDNIRLVTWDENNRRAHSDMKSGINNKKSKRVLQLTLDGDLVKEWYSISDAGRNGYSKVCISGCCNGKNQTHKGFIWKFSK